MQRRIEAGIIVLVGIALIAVVLIAQLFTRAPAFERLTDDFRAPMSTQSIETLKADLAGMQAMTEELQTDVLPTIAGAMGMTTDELTAYMGENFPQVSQGLEMLPSITTNFTQFAGTLEGEQARFEAADSIPTNDLPATTIPWGMLAAAILIIGAGFLMMRTERLGSYFALGLGIVLIAAPLILSLPTKASKADDLNKNLRPIMTTEQVDGSVAALGTISAMGTEMQEVMFPALAEGMGISIGEVKLFMSDFTATNTMLESMPVLMERFDGMVATLGNNIDEYNTIKPLSLAPIVWILMAAGLLVGTAGVLGFFAPEPVTSGRHRHAVATH